MAKYFTGILLFLSLGCGSSSIVSRGIALDTIYESKSGPLYRGSRLTFTDSSFVYVGSGPSIFYCKGRYKLNGEVIILKSGIPNARFINRQTVDTLWVDLHDKTIRILSDREIVLDSLSYFKR